MRSYICFNHYTAIFGLSKHVKEKMTPADIILRVRLALQGPSLSFCHCTFDFYTSERPEDKHVIAETCGRTLIQHNTVRCV